MKKIFMVGLVLAVFVLGIVPVALYAQDAASDTGAPAVTETMTETVTETTTNEGTETDVTEDTEETVTDTMEETEVAYGTVVSAASDSIKISEFNFGTEAAEEVTYAIDPEIELNNVESVAKIKAGDKVEIEYVVKEGKKTAVYIYVEETV